MINSDLLIGIGIVLASALVLHLKSHVKFIAMGAFIGLVLAEFIALPVQQFSTKQVAWFGSDGGIAFIKLTLLLLPAAILGLNHTVDKRKIGLGRTVVTVVSSLLFLLANILVFLPPNWRDSLRESSTIAFELIAFRTWLVVIMALVIVVDSFHHKATLQKLRKKSKP